MSEYVFIITERADLLVLDSERQNKNTIKYYLLGNDLKVYEGLVKKKIVKDRLLENKWKLLGKKEAKKLHKTIYENFSKVLVMS